MNKRSEDRQHLPRDIGARCIHKTPTTGPAPTQGRERISKWRTMFDLPAVKCARSDRVHQLWSIDSLQLSGTLHETRDPVRAWIHHRRASAGINGRCGPQSLPQPSPAHGRHPEADYRRPIPACPTPEIMSPTGITLNLETRLHY